MNKQPQILVMAINIKISFLFDYNSYIYCNFSSYNFKNHIVNYINIPNIDRLKYINNNRLIRKYLNISPYITYT